MKPNLSKHQINREIYRNLYGKYPVNPALDENVKAKFDPIRKQTTRTLEVFSKLFNFQYQAFCEKDFRSLGRYHCNTHSFDYTIAQLVIIEVTYRFNQSSRQLNAQRTKTAGHIINSQWSKLRTDSIGLFFCPFLNVIESSNPEFVTDFKRKFCDNASINGEIHEYVRQIPVLISNLS